MSSLQMTWRKACLDIEIPLPTPGIDKVPLVLEASGLNTELLHFDLRWNTH